MHRGALTFLFVAIACATTSENTSVDECTPCNPQGATSKEPPSIGPELDSLYVDILNSIKDIHFRKRWEDTVVRLTDAFCCRENLDCVNVMHLNVPICYDKFTTQYAFPDGSWGSLTTGEYHETDGGKANLISGDFAKAGAESGNIYDLNPAAKPNTATLSIPPQWTGTGVGSAIPPTEIASVVTNIPDTRSTVQTTAAAITGTRGTDAAAGPSALPSSGDSVHVSAVMNSVCGMSLFSALMYALQV